jgi:argininosuccinate synthase
LAGDSEAVAPLAIKREAIRHLFYLYRGNIIAAGRKSSKSLYDPKIATMEGDESSYDQNDATGFIRLNALRLKLRALRDQSG